jgi:hypothetical protein
VASGRRSGGRAGLEAQPLPRAYVLSLCDKPGQPDQVVGSVAEDEQPVQFFQSPKLYSARSDLLQPTEFLLKGDIDGWEQHEQSAQ